MANQQTLIKIKTPKVAKESYLDKAGYLLKAMRPRQWTKNLIVFIPIIFASKATEPRPLLITAAFAIAFCLASSAMYLFNDVVDREQDRLHPRKCNRPIAAGKISVPMALGVAAVLAVSALILSALLRPSLAFVMLLYVLLMTAYGTVLKHQAILDVMVVAAGFVMRAFGGCLAAAVPSSGWFLLCTSLGALFLALEKRRHELAVLADTAQDHRSVLTAYTRRLLDRIEGIVVPTLLICYILYSFLSWHGQWMMITVPFAFYGLVRYQLLSDEGELTGTPEEVLLNDRPTQVAVFLWLVSAVGVLYGLIPRAYEELGRLLDSMAFFRF
jgi:4-hydroxybenzoate polyprenyltransferase